MPPERFDPRDLVELRVRGEHIDVIGMLSMLPRVVDYEGDDVAGLDRGQRVVLELMEAAQEQVNFGEVERQLKQIVERGESVDFRGLDVRIHEFDPRHPDERSELDVDALPPFESADEYAVVLKNEEGFHMAGYPDEMDTEAALQMASVMRTYARELEEAVLQESYDPRGEGDGD